MSGGMMDGPLYRRIETDITARISSGEWAQGSPIPPEPELQERYGVSRTTVRKAVENLVAAGLLVIQHGQGTRVAPQHGVGRAVVMGFSQVLTEQGITPGSRNLSLEVVPAPADVAAALALPGGHREPAPGAELTTVVELVRLRTGDGTPISHSTTWLPRAVLTGSIDGLAGGSLYDTLETTFGLVIATTRDSYGIELADADLADALSLDRGTPVLLIERHGFDRTGRPLEVSRIRVRTDRYRPTITLRRR